MIVNPHRTEALVKKGHKKGKGTPLLQTSGAKYVEPRTSRRCYEMQRQNRSRCTVRTMQIVTETCDEKPGGGKRSLSLEHLYVRT